MGLLDLPAELRNEVYLYAFTDDEDVDIDPATIHAQTALTRTCSQIRNETSGMFYACNTFRVTVRRGNVNQATEGLQKLDNNAPLIQELVLMPVDCSKSAVWHGFSIVEHIRAVKLEIENDVVMVQQKIRTAVAAGLSLKSIRIQHADAARDSLWKERVPYLLTTWLASERRDAGF